MGSSASALSSSELPGSDLRLPETRLHFTLNQLRALNQRFDALCEESDRRQMSGELESTVEGLVQRLVDGAAQKDPRFRCQHLIALHREKRLRSRSLEYLVTLNALPILNSGDAECSLQEGPAGYARVKLSGHLAELWEDFLTPAGYLWRDKLVERWVELVAGCAAGGRPGAPGGVTKATRTGRVLGARAALAATPSEYCYLEKASPPASSSGSEYRLAIVEGAVWVCVRVRTGAGVEAEAKLALALRGAGGTANAAHPSRLPLTHPMALLHYTAANTGFFTTAVGPPSSLSCPERQATWQLWHPAMEAELDAHHAEFSGVGRITNVLNAVVDNLRDGRVKPGLRVLSRYAVSCTLRRRLETCCNAPTFAARAFLATHTSHHVLAVLDRLVTLCSSRSCDSYAYDTPCLARGGARSSDAEWKSDAACLKNYLALLHAETVKAEEIPPSMSETLESVLFRRWETLIREMRVSGVGGVQQTYSRKQLVYLMRVCKEVIHYKNNVTHDKHSAFRSNLIDATSQHQEPIEDLIHILAIMLDQARDQYLRSQFKQRHPDLSPDHLSYRSKKINKLRDYYEVSSACLIDAIRRDPDIRNEDLTDEVNKMKNIINCLFKGMRDDKKYLGPVLRPFLEELYNSSHENCWFMEEFDEKKLAGEYEGLRMFCAGVDRGSVDPCRGLLDAAKKLAWAKAVVDFVDRYKHCSVKLVFPLPEGGRASYPARLVSRSEDVRARHLTLTERDKAHAKLKLARRCVLNAFTAGFAGEQQRKLEKQEYPSTSSKKSEEFLSSTKNGQYWRNSTKPDLITSNALLEQLGSTSSLATEVTKTLTRRPRKPRPATSYGYPDLSIHLTQGNMQTMKRKYHTLKSLVYADSVESIRELRDRPKSAGNTVRSRQPMSRPNILETLDFINGVRDALCVEESGTSDLEDAVSSPEDDSLMREVSPLNLLARLTRAQVPHNTLGNVVTALISMGKFTVLQELSSWLGEGRSGALFALHRLARATRSRSLSGDRRISKLSRYTTALEEPPQRYRLRPPDYFSGDEAPSPPPQPPPSPRQQHTHSRKHGRKTVPQQHYTDYAPPKRLNPNMELHKSLSVLNLGQPNQHERPILNEKYTGIINPLYDERKISQKFTNKRSKSLGRSSSRRKDILEATRYNITLGPRSGRQTNDVVTALMSTTGETGLDYKGAYFQRFSSSGIVGDSYKISRVSID